MELPVIAITHPAFGARLLEALQAEGAAATFHALVYDWAKPQQLKPLLDRLSRNGAALAGSTEGGLFEYASNEQIVANLEVTHAGAPDDCVMVGPVVRDASSLDPRLRPAKNVEGRPAIRCLGLEAFGGLAIKESLS